MSRLCITVQLLARQRSKLMSPLFSTSFAKSRTDIHTSSGPLRTNDSQKEFSRYPIPPMESLPKDILERMRETAEKSGFIPNVHLALSHRPEEFNAFFHHYDILMATERGKLTKADKEMIVVATSAENGCLYCIISHSALFRIFSKNPILADQIAGNWRTADLDDRQKAILEFAMDICHCKALTKERFENLEKHGLDSEDAWDIGAITAFFAMSNRMAFLTNMKPNKEFYLLGRIPREKKT